MSISDKTRQTREGSLGWMVQRLARQIDARMTEGLQKQGLTIQQFAILMTVLENPGRNQTSIGVGFSMAPYAVSRALDALEEMGLIERRASETSRRAHEIHATPAGIAKAPELRKLVAEVNGEFTSGLSAAENAELLALMRRVMK